MDIIDSGLQGDYDKVFPSRLRNLMEDYHVSQQKLADYLGLKNRQSVASYRTGRSAPDLDSIVKIASFFDVSTDYLLGATDDPAPRPSAVDDLGLSPEAVRYLRKLHEFAEIPPLNDTRLSLLSYLLEDRRFDYMLAMCEKYVKLMGTVVDREFENSADYIACVDTLKAHGYDISTSDIKANTIFSVVITTLLRTLLDERAKRTGELQATPVP